ncbi:MAG: hypothetical protein EA384_15250 [Spirochaetaceae bacterium]|nr:MAG: hypothetical protein EA384_15250 [Spirochaetaceae bacterium]
MGGVRSSTDRASPVVAVFLAVGLAETVGQVLLVRELLVNFQGNELSLGVILACWLLLTGLGSWLLGKVAGRIPARPQLFVVTVILYAVVLPVQLFLARVVNTLVGVAPGQVPGLAAIVLACLIVLTPVCLLHGFQFPFACRILARRKGTAVEQVAGLYIAEALGGMAGGILFAYLLVHYFDHLAIAALTVVFNLAAALLLLSPVFSFRFFTGKLVIGALCLAAVLALGSGALQRLELLFSRRQWRGHELVSVENTVYQNIAVTRKAGQLNFFANGLLLFTSPVPDITFVEETAHFPLLHHARPRTVLLIGGGVGGVLEEIAKHRVEIHYVEPDPRIIRTAERYLPAGFPDDGRVTVEYTDGRLFLERTTGEFDAVIMNLPPPSTLQVNRFYTREFFKAVRAVLRDRGLFAFGIPSSEAYMTEEMLRLNRSIHTTLNEVFAAVSVIPDDYTILLASDDPALPALDAAEISRRLADRQLETRLFTSHYIEHKLGPERVSRLTGYLHERGEINHDRRPIATFHSLALWNAMFHPRLRGAFELARTVRAFWLAAVPPLLLLPLLRPPRRRRPAAYPVALALFTSGFAGMTFTIVLLFLFQLSYGHLYQKIGVLTAAFMLGLASGGWVMKRRINRLPGEVAVLGWIVVVLASYACALPWLALRLSGGYGVAGELPFSVLNLAGGFLIGLQFPLACRIYLRRTGSVAPAVGLLYAADLWGSVLGAFLAAILLIPVLGVVQTGFVIGALSLTAGAVLFIDSRR